MGTSEAHKATVTQLWADLYRRDFDAVGSHFAPDGEYTDIPSPDDDVARGPTQIAARLRLGLEPLSEFRHHHLRAMVADGDLVVSEHAEEWRWPTGEQVVLPFVSVHEFRDGQIVRWWDYWNMATLMDAAPAWWVEHIMQGYR